MRFKKNDTLVYDVQVYCNLHASDVRLESLKKRRKETAQANTAFNK